MLAGVAKKIVIILGVLCSITVLVFGSIIVVLLVTNPTGNEPVLKTREETIPSGATKYDPTNDLYPPVLHNSLWDDPIPLEGPINTAGAEDAPFISLDGNQFFFFFTPNASIEAQYQVNDGVTGIWWSQKNGDSWTEPERVFLGWDCLDGCPFYLNETLWFCSIRDEDGAKIFTAEFQGNEWDNIQEACNQLNDEYCIGEMHLTADGKKLYFHANLPDGKGNYDIWMTELVGNQWQEPVNLETINTNENDFLPFVTADNSELWFTRTYLGSPGIFRSLWNGTHWQEPELILSNFAGEPTLDPNGNLYFVHHFVEDGEILEADIYVCYKK
jgi:hypothetical protein